MNWFCLLVSIVASTKCYCASNLFGVLLSGQIVLVDVCCPANKHRPTMYKFVLNAWLIFAHTTKQHFCVSFNTLCSWSRVKRAKQKQPKNEHRRQVNATEHKRNVNTKHTESSRMNRERHNMNRVNVDNKNETKCREREKKATTTTKNTKIYPEQRNRLGRLLPSHRCCDVGITCRSNRTYVKLFDISNSLYTIHDCFVVECILNATLV